MQHSHEGRCDGCDMMWSDNVVYMRYNDRIFVACHNCREWVDGDKEKFLDLLARSLGSAPHFDMIIAAAIPQYMAGDSLKGYMTQDFCENTKLKYHYLRACVYRSLRGLPALW